MRTGMGSLFCGLSGSSVECVLVRTPRGCGSLFNKINKI